MTDLISRDDAVVELNKILAHELAMGNFHGDSVASDCIEVIQNAPTVDAVEVVRCKECKYGMNHDFGCGYNHFACCDMEDGIVQFAKSVNEDDFCSYGERR